MNENGITAADGGSPSGTHPPPSSYPHQHHQSIIKYDDYVWAANRYSPSMGSGSDCGTEHGTPRKQEQPSLIFQGHYPVNRTMGSSQQYAVTREQHWGLGTQSQHQGGMIQYSHGMYGVYPNQVHTSILPVPQQPAPMQKPSPAALHHQQQPQQQHYGMVPNGEPCSSGIQVCRNDSYQEVNQDYIGIKRTSAHHPSTNESFPVNASGTSLVPTKEHHLQVLPPVVDKKHATQCHDTEPPFSTPTMAITTPETVSEPTLVSLQPQSEHASVLPNPGISTTSALSSIPQRFTNPPLKVQTLRPPVVSFSPSSVTSPEVLSNSMSASSQTSQGSKSSSPVRSSVTITQGQSLASRSVTSAVQHLELSPIVENQDSRSLQVTQSPFSQSHLPVHSRPVFSLAQAQSVLISPSKFTSPKTNFLTDTAVLCTFPASSTIASTFPFTAPVSSQKFLSAHQFSEPPFAANTNVVLSSSSSSPRKGHTTSDASEQQTTDMQFSPMKSNNVSEVSWSHRKVNAASLVCKQEGNTCLLNDALDNIPESSLSIPSNKLDKNDLPVVKKDICTSKDLGSTGKMNENPLNNTWDTGTKNVMSLGGIIYVNSTESVERCEHIQDEGSSMFTDGSINKDCGHRMPERDQTDDTTQEKEAVDLTTASPTDALTFKNNSQIHDSLDDTSQADTSQHFPSSHDFSDRIYKVADTGGQGCTGISAVDSCLPLPTMTISITKKAACKPTTTTGSASPLQSSLKGVKRTRAKSTSKVPKEQKEKRKRKEKIQFSIKINKASKETTASPLPDGSASHVLNGGFISDLHINHNVVHPVAKSDNIKKARRKKTAGKSLAKEDNDKSNLTGETPRRRIPSEEQVIFPLLNGWRREIRVRKLDDRLKGETWYYSPCGRRMKQFSEVIKYLNRHEENLKGVTREHFSFSPRMPVGDFYEERDTPEGKRWFLLANEEVPSMIMSITGKRGRPPNTDKEVKHKSRTLQPKRASRRRPGRPPKLNVVSLLSKIDARVLKRLEEKEELTKEDKVILAKIKKKMKKKLAKVRKTMRQDHAQSLDPDTYQSVNDGPKKPCWRRKAQVEQSPEKICPLKRIAGARSKAKALAKAQAEAEAQAQAALAAKKQAERRAQAKRRLEERKRQQKILEELKKPTEDMCLTDQLPLPELSRIPGLVLSGSIFSHCVTVVEFLHSFGKVLGLQVPKDIPSLATMQEGLLGIGKSQSELLDLLINLVSAVLHDPGLPPYYQSVKILGEKLVDLELCPSTVSEVLRVFLESHAFERDICNSLCTKSFQALSPEVKASILVFLVEELNGSNTVITEIDKTLENMTTYKKNKWIIDGKLRKMKAALARKTGRSEAELCCEERRRSTRVRVAEDESLADSSFLENGSPYQHKDKLKICEDETSNNASVPELERQIDKLTKRQEFFHKKLLQSAHYMRAMSLGQDRYQRRYWLLPNIGGVLVEGQETILASGDVLLKDEPMPSAEIAVLSSLNVDDIVETQLSAVHKDTKTLQPFCSHSSNIASPPSVSSPPNADPLPGEASLMSSPRGWGRPRKIRPEVELHLRTIKSRRRRHSKSGAENNNGGNQSEDHVKEHIDRTPLLPKEETLCPSSATSLCSVKETPLPFGSSPHLRPVTLPEALKPGRRYRKGRGAGYRNSEADAVKCRGKLFSSPFQEMEQMYFTQLVIKPIPHEMLKGWWWVSEPEELVAILTALHPRGIREKVLCKNLAKHMKFLTERCSQPMTDPIFHLKVKDDQSLLEALKQPWEEQKHAMQIDISVLKMVEDLEHRVVEADLNLKVFNAPEPDSAREDLQYYEHVVDPRDDWMMRSKKETFEILRVLTNPLDLAMMRLINLERNIERRYLKGPLWILAEVMRFAPVTLPTEGEEIAMDTLSLENEITPRLRLWRQALDRCRSASQLYLCLLQLERAIAWEKSIVKVTCRMCRKGDNDACLLLCDGCDGGWHMYCLRPKVTQVPEGDWFCPTCKSLETSEDSQPKHSARQRAKERKKGRLTYGGESSNEEQRHRQSMTTRQKYGHPASRGTSGSPSKRRRMATRNQPDLTYCEIILMEMEAHVDAWPFLEPVNPRLVAGYRRIIKNPMDFLTMRQKLLRGGYCTCVEFAADAQLVFNNCELFNEDTSEVGTAGHSMRRFFESRWAEFFSYKENHI